MPRAHGFIRLHPELLILKLQHHAILSGVLSHGLTWRLRRRLLAGLPYGAEMS